ncbi:hypothetical protein Tco_0547789, partial [Tanacetum coccineum]
MFANKVNFEVELSKDLKDASNEMCMATGKGLWSHTHMSKIDIESQLKSRGDKTARSSVKLLGEIKDLLERNPNRERLFRRTVFGPWLDILSHDNDNHLMHHVLQHQIWILESYPNSKKWWSKKDNVLTRALAWLNVIKFEKNDYNRLFGSDSNPNLKLYATPVEKQTGWFIASIQFINCLVYEDFNVSQDDGVGVVSGNCVDLQHNSVSAVSVLSADSHEGLNEARVANNKMLLLEGGDSCFDSEGGATNPECNKDKPPTLADVLDEVRALRKEVALVKFDDARISKLERILNDNFMFRNDIIPNDNHNAINQGVYGSANHPMSTCSGADILDGEVVGALIGFHKADGRNDSPNVNHNAVNKVLSGSDNDPM